MGEVSMLFYEGSKVYMNQGYPTVFLDGKNIWINGWFFERGDN